MNIFKEWSALRHEWSLGNSKQEFIINKMERIIEAAAKEIEGLKTQVGKREGWEEIDWSRMSIPWASDECFDVKCDCGRTIRVCDTDRCKCGRQYAVHTRVLVKMSEEGKE